MAHVNHPLIRSSLMENSVSAENSKLNLTPHEFAEVKVEMVEAESVKLDFNAVRV